jgi:hypothetical protein
MAAGLVVVPANASALDNIISVGMGDADACLACKDYTSTFIVCTRKEVSGKLVGWTECDDDQSISGTHSTCAVSGALCMASGQPPIILGRL